MQSSCNSVVVQVNIFSNPPMDYVSDNVKSGNTCVVCDVEFEVEDSLDEHIRRIHKDVVKKTFSREAFEMVMTSENYTEWLKKTSAKKARGRNKLQCLKCKKQIKFLLKSLIQKMKMLMRW